MVRKQMGHTPRSNRGSNGSDQSPRLRHLAGELPGGAWTPLPDAVGGSQLRRSPLSPTHPTHPNPHMQSAPCACHAAQGVRTPQQAVARAAGDTTEAKGRGGPAPGAASSAAKRGAGDQQASAPSSAELLVSSRFWSATALAADSESAAAAAGCWRGGGGPWLAASWGGRWPPEERRQADAGGKVQVHSACRGAPLRCAARLGPQLPADRLHFAHPAPQPPPRPPRPSRARSRRRRAAPARPCQRRQQQAAMATAAPWSRGARTSWHGPRRCHCPTQPRWPRRWTTRATPRSPPRSPPSARSVGGVPVGQRWCRGGAGVRACAGVVRQ
jgi:hypothetical protein